MLKVILQIDCCFQKYDGETEIKTACLPIPPNSALKTYFPVFDRNAWSINCPTEKEYKVPESEAGDACYYTDPVADKTSSISICNAKSKSPTLKCCYQSIR